MSDEIKIARAPFSGTGNKTIKLNEVFNMIFIINDGPGNLTFTVSTLFLDWFTFTLSPGEVFEQTLRPFHILTITATGKYRGWFRKNEEAEYFSSDPQFLYR
jgi:hypothetical protein